MTKILITQLRLIFSVGIFSLAFTIQAYASITSPEKYIQYCAKTSISSGEYNPFSGELKLNFNAPDNTSLKIENQQIDVLTKLDKLNNKPLSTTSTPVTPKCSPVLGQTFFCTLNIPLPNFTQIFSNVFPTKPTSPTAKEIQEIKSITGVDVNYDIKALFKELPVAPAQECAQADKNTKVDITVANTNQAPQAAAPGGNIGSSGTSTKVCTPKDIADGKCSFGGGEKCDIGRGPAIKTAIGCLHTTPAEFVKDFMTFVIAIGGGLAFLMMLLGAFQMLTSQGNPETLNAGRERLTSAAIGLLFIIFSILFLQIIGMGILKIPGFGP